MQHFTDNEGDQWAVSLTILTLRNVEEETGEKLLNMFADKLEMLHRISSDYGLLVTILHVVCRKQIDQKGLSCEEFAERFGGDSLADAHNALVQAVIDFFPDQSRREGLRGMVERLNRAAEMMRTQAAPHLMEKFDRITAKMSEEDWGNLLSGSGSSGAES